VATGIYVIFFFFQTNIIAFDFSFLSPVEVGGLKYIQGDLIRRYPEDLDK
jgi:hypothetical protein